MRLHKLILAGLVAFGGVCQAADEFVYTVQVGDHPWNIAQRFLQHASFAQQLTRLNRISNDRTIPPGTRLRIPAQWLKLESLWVRVLAAHGETMLQQPGQLARAVVVGERLPAQSQLRTGPRASATLEFEDGSRVMVRQTSELRLVRSDRRMLDGGFMVELELLRGSLENMVTPRLRRPETRFEIRTPAAVAAVRGTQFRVHSDPGTTWTEVLGGAVQVGNTAGAVLADAGFGTVAQAGQAPDPPRALLAAPDLSDLPARLERLPINWPLTPVPGALAYRTQLAPDARFETVLSDETSTPARARVLDIDDGNYMLRVTAIDAQGLQGLAADRPVLVHARPQAPALISPEPGASLATPRPVFNWTQGDASWHYLLEIRPDGPGSDAPLHVQSSPSAHGTQLSVDLLPGVYRWRVASVIPATGRQGPWGDAQKFRVVLPSPVLEPAQIQPDMTTIRWPAIPHAIGYDLQVTSDADFTQPFHDVRSSTPQQQLHELGPGSYRLRVRAVSQDGFPGRWSGPQEFVIAEPVKPEPSPWRALLILLPALILLGL